MNRIRFSSLMLLTAGIILSACSLLHTPEPVDYEAMNQTAAAELTQTAEAMPTATFTPLPTSTPTDTPAPTATEIPVPTATEEDLMITRNEGNEDDMMIVRRDEPLQLPTATPILPTATVYFPDKADFVAFLPSPNQFVPNQHFYLTWQLKNTGTSTWSGKYRFYYSEGIHLADQDSWEFDQTVEPGGVLTVTLPATAPDAIGTYKTTWILENPDGIPFYYVNFIAIVGDRTFITEVPGMVPTATPASLEWMCSDADRSMIQGDGCVEFCTASVLQQMADSGLTCYANGVKVENEE